MSYIILTPMTDWQLHCMNKHYDFDTAIVNFPFLCSNVPLSSNYGVYISKLIWYARVCFAYEDFSKRGKVLTKKVIFEVYNEPHLKSSFRKLYGLYNDFDCNYKLSLAYTLSDLFHTLCQTVVFILALTTGDPVYLISTRVHDWYYRSADEPYSSLAPDPSFAFVVGSCCLTLDFVFALWIMLTFDILLTSLFCLSCQS
jgi:hypothetical protein